MINIESRKFGGHSENQVSLNDTVSMSLYDLIKLVNNDKKFDVQKLNDAIAEDEKKIEHNLPLKMQSLRIGKAYSYLATYVLPRDCCRKWTPNELKTNLNDSGGISLILLTKAEQEDIESMKEYCKLIESFKRVLFNAMDSYVLSPYEKRKGQAVTLNLRDYAFKALLNFTKELEMMSENPKTLESRIVFDEIVYDLLEDKVENTTLEEVA